MAVELNHDEKSVVGSGSVYDSDCGSIDNTVDDPDYMDDIDFDTVEDTMNDIEEDSEDDIACLLRISRSENET